MSFVRHFTLINADGDEYDITNKEVLLTDPKGLGMKRDNSYRKIGNRFFLLSKKRAQEDFEGVVNFTPPDAYIKYNEFMAFITKEPLKLRYKPIDNYDYYRYRGVFPKLDYIFYQDVMIGSIEKKDLTKYGSLECQIRLNQMTPWYRSVRVEAQKSGAGDGVVWESSSTFTWKWESTDEKSLTIESDAHMDSPCKLMIPGPVINPKWRQYVGGKKIAEGQVNCVVPYDQYLVIDNTTEAPSITIEGGGETMRSVYQEADFTKDRFINIQNGSNYIIAEFDGEVDKPIIAEAMLFYESV